MSIHDMLKMHVAMAMEISHKEFPVNRELALCTPDYTNVDTCITDDSVVERMSPVSLDAEQIFNLRLSLS